MSDQIVVGDGARFDVERSREQVNRLRQDLKRYWVGKDDIVDLICICAVAQEPLLVVGRPGTAKSDLVIKFAQAMGMDTASEDYFEYMLTQFSEPGEIIGPIDVNALKQGRHMRRIQGKLPVARVAFLDEIFKSNSAILNTLLTILNERKFYQDGRPEPVKLKMLFAATNEIPENPELGALIDRFPLKVESRSVRGQALDELLLRGLQHEVYKAANLRPWVGRASLDDFTGLKLYLDGMLQRDFDGEVFHRARAFPEEVFQLFVRVMRSLEKEFRFEVSDRKFIKLYKLIRTRAFLFHGGVVNKGDLVLLRYIGDRSGDLEAMQQSVDQMLRID